MGTMRGIVEVQAEKWDVLLKWKVRRADKGQKGAPLSAPFYPSLTAVGSYVLMFPLSLTVKNAFEIPS